MASSKDYLTFVLEQLSDLEGITYRAMMGEYILYFREKIVGGIYDDDRLLVKPVPSAIALIYCISSLLCVLIISTIKHLIDCTQYF